MLSKKDKLILDYALVKASEHDSGGRQRLWAVATDSKNKILAEAGNHYLLTHPLQERYNGASRRNENKLHAEIHLLAKLARSGKKANKIFVARSRRDILSGLAKPCVICELALNKAGMTKVFWTENDQ